MKKPNGFDTEKKPIETELTSRIQWSNIFTGNYDYMEKYTKPNNNEKDNYGQIKPSYTSDEKISPPKERWEKAKGI